MDEDVARLVREQRLVAAAELASERGDARTASDLFERACDFRRAATEAMRAADWARALPLALEGKELALAAEALPRLAEDSPAAERVAFQLERRGDHGWSAQLLERIGRREAAARAYERAGDAGNAATILEELGDVVSAARVLEAQLRREPARDDLHVALGGLLLRYGKVDAAIRTLQRVGAVSPQRRLALTLLAQGLESLGLARAKVEADAELAKLGGPLAVPGGKSATAVRARLFGRYEVVREIASSPHARVLECLDGVRTERVALKIFAGYDARGSGRDALARFEREVKVLGTLDHPNVLPLREYVPEGPALVLAWMSGGTLDQMIASEPLAPSRAIEIARAILSALGEAHRLGVIHRDVKPANVLFDDAGVTRLGDFGVAHLSDLSATATAGVIGTLGYMSPEQREGHPATVKSDIFAVGAILWEMLTNERPGVEAPRVRPSAIHNDLDARHDSLVLSFLSHDPTARPEDAFAARRALAALPWPSTIERIAAPRVERPRSEHPASARLLEDVRGRVDQWLDRLVRVVPLDERSLARASAFARAEHPSLPLVLRVDREERGVWVAAPRGRPLAGPLTQAQREDLWNALARLHAMGAVHGYVDRAHVFVDEEGAVVLGWTDTPDATATADTDRVALARLP